MAETNAKTFFPGLYVKLEKKRQTAKAEPMGMAEINILLSIQFNNKPVYPTIDIFYSDAYKQAVESGASSVELEKISRFRLPTDREINLLYSDIHAREEKHEYASGNAGS